MAELFKRFFNDKIKYSEEEYNEELKEGKIISKNYITYWAVKRASSTYISIDDFNHFLHKFLSYRLKNGKVDTDQNFNYHIKGCYNVVYIDIDYLYDLKTEDDTLESVTDFNSELASIINKIVIEKYPDCHYISFVPKHIEKYKDNEYRAKGGIHTFVFLNECISNPKSKIEIFTKLICNDERFKEIYELHCEKLLDSNSNQISINSFIDQQTLSKATTLIPFAQKDVQSRLYKLYEHNIDDVLGHKKFKWIIPCENPEDGYRCEWKNNNVDNFNFQEYYNKSKNEIGKKILTLEYVKKVYENCINDDSDVYFNQIRKIDSFIFNFMDGLGTLCNDTENQHVHLFYKEYFLGWGDKRRFENLLVKFYITLMVVNLGKHIPNDFNTIAKRILELLTPIYVRLGKLNSSEKLQTLEWCTKNTTDLFSKYKQKGETYREYLNAPEKGSKDQAGKPQLRADAVKGPIIAEMEGIIRSIIASWCKFVNKYILKPITFEIEPFEWKNYNRGKTGLTFENVLPVISRIGNSMESSHHKKTEYMRQMRNLNTMFIFTQTYEKGVNQIENIIGDIITQYVKSYLIYIKDETSSVKDDGKSIYIYNIKQTEDLDKYPYNQWIIDKENNLMNWVFVIYKNLFEPILDTSATDKPGGLAMPFKILETTKFVEKINPGKLLNALKSPFNYARGSKNLLANILATYKSERHITPAPEEPEHSYYFALRNGILKWEEDVHNKWHCKFEIDNRGIKLNAYTLINYIDPDHYDKTNPYYTKLFESICKVYPIEEERNYMLDLFSTVIVPFIKKDQILEVFGTGGDGKSTMNMILMNMLGNARNSGTNYIENGKKILLSVPAGYSGNVESSTFTKHKQQTNGHDEGGKINMARKTFVVCQEPEKNRPLVTNVIKDLTSGSISHGRKIHQGEIMFVNNALIVIETNDLLNYDDVDDAVRRRMIVYKHQSKFTTNVNEHQMKNVKYHYEADSDLIKAIYTTTNYWDALFQILLEHAIGVLNKGYRNISDIKPPKSVIEFTQHSFNISSPLLKYLFENYEENPDKFMLVRDLIKEINDYNSEEISNGNSSLFEVKNKSQINTIIIKELQKKYSGSFYRLNQKYYTKTASQLKSNWYFEFEKDIEELNIDEIIKQCTDGNGALTDLSQDSRYKYENLIIKGYCKKDLEEMEDMF